MTLQWAIATDEGIVHALIEASDRAAAERSGGIAPRRRRESTRYLVSRGVVHLGTAEAVPVVTVTVGPDPSFSPEQLPLPPAERPWCMQRLAVHPRCPEPLAGVQAVRYAIEVASAAGADALRAEANPDLADVLRVLTALGFTRYHTDDSAPAPRTYLQLALPGRPPASVPPADGPR